MKLTEKRNEPRIVTIGYRCDVCGLEHHGDSPIGWFHGSHQHNRCGNDSFESVEHFNLCSAECFKTQLHVSLNELKSFSNTAEIFDMSYEFADKLYQALK